MHEAGRSEVVDRAAARRVARSGYVLVLLLLSVTAPSCDVRMNSAWDWKRMRSQNKLSAYKDGPTTASLRAPPPGTVSRESAADDSASMLPTDPSRGQTRYETFCSVCHGSTGNGESVVGSNMDGPKPPSLLTNTASDRDATTRDARVFAAVTNGVGRMPGFAGEISAHDRWQIVAYVSTLARRAHSSGTK